MDISTENLKKMEAKLNKLLAELNNQKEEPKQVLNLINATAEQYAEAWKVLSTINIIQSHVKALLEMVQRGDFKKVGLFIDFTIYQLERFGEKSYKQDAVYMAQHAILDIYNKFRKTYYIA